MTIKVLDQATVSRIAAGEVIERPASAVKELVENSLDAGARHVEILLRKGELSVTDDGCGMGPKDLELAVQRHATSKISQAGDLETLATYGFRGEALPSIAAVSELELRSRRAEDQAGARLVVDGDRVLSRGGVPMPQGTVAVVRRLFHNTPVRSRFLKAEAAETARALAVLERLALARPDVAFRCLVGDRLALQTPGTGDHLEAVLAVWGLDTAKEIRTGRAADAAYGAVLALVGGPGILRSNRRLQMTAVNGRPVVVRGLLEAAEASYPFGVLPGRKHPALLLLLDLPPSAVDANVHPAKSEVRLAKEGEVLRLVVLAVRDAQGAAAALAAEGAGPMRAGEGAGPSPAMGGLGVAARRTASRLPWPDRVGEPLADWGQRPRDSLEGLEPLGQVSGTWIACAGRDGLVLVDQHAAHERVLFERLGRRRGPAGGQLLAVPEAVELGPSEFEVWLRHREALEALGFETGSLGGRTVIVRQVPLEAVEQGSASHLLASTLAQMTEEERLTMPLPAELRLRRALSSCAAAVKARQSLGQAEMRALLHELGACEEPWRCPHGRPTAVVITSDELARRFGR